MKPCACLEAVQWAAQRKRPMLIEGPPGIGKSSIVRQAAGALGLELLDVRAVLLDPVDLRGLPHVNSDNRAHWCPPAFLPESGEGILFLDELPQAAPMVQSACLQLTLDRQIGEYHLPPGWTVIAAGNRPEDRTGSHRLIEALRDRFIAVGLDVSTEDWQAWASRNDVAQLVRSFIDYRPNLLHDFRPETKAQAYPTPRSWATASEIYETAGHDVQFEMIAGCVGEGPATEFTAFVELQQHLPAIDAILADPEHHEIPQKKPGLLYALCGALAERCKTADSEALDAFSRFVTRLPAEFTMLAMRDAVAANRALLDVPAAIAWMRQHRDLLGVSSR